MIYNYKRSNKSDNKNYLQIKGNKIRKNTDNHNGKEFQSNYFYFPD